MNVNLLVFMYWVTYSYIGIIEVTNLKNAHFEGDLVSYKNYILTKLSTKYPDKYIENYNDIISDTTLYALISKEAHDENLQPKEWLTINEYKVRQRYSSSSIDADFIRRIHLEFNLGQTALSGLLKNRVTKQWIDNIIKTNLPTAPESKWTEKELDLIDREQIQLLIDEGKLCISKNEYETTLINDCKGNYCIIIYNTDTDIYKVFFKEDIDDSLVTAIEQERLHELSDDELYIIQQCDTVYVMKKKCLSLEDKHFNSLFYKASKHRDMSRKQFAEFLGFDNAVSSKEKKDTDFISFFESNLIDQRVYISSSPINQWIRSYASRVGLTLSDFISFFGYKHDERSFNSIRTKKLELYKQELQEYVYNESNKVYLPSTSILYQNLYRIALFEGVLLDDIIGELGFERVDKKDYDKILKSSSFHSAMADEIRRKFLDEINLNPHVRTPSKAVNFNVKNRNQKLVKELKELYNFKCQLCSSNVFECPEIIINDQLRYVEVHHIIPLSNEMYDEELYLDNIENVIVVCPYHHKALHFHLGGSYHHIKLISGEFFLVNGNNKFKIYVNYHLKEME